MLNSVLADRDRGQPAAGFSDSWQIMGGSPGGFRFPASSSADRSTRDQQRVESGAAHDGEVLAVHGARIDHAPFAVAACAHQRR